MPSSHGLLQVLCGFQTVFYMEQKTMKDKFLHGVHKILWKT